MAMAQTCGEQGKDAEDAEALLDIAQSLEEKPSRDRADVAPRADQTGHPAERFAIDEGDQSIGRTAGHVREQTEGDHGDDRAGRRIRARKPEETHALSEHEDEEEECSGVEAPRPGEAVREDAAERAREESEEAEAPCCQSRRLEAELEAVDIVARRHVVDEELGSEAGAVRHEEHPRAVVGHGLLEDRPSAFLPALDLNAQRTKLDIVSLRTVLREFPVQHRDDEHQRARNAASRPSIPPNCRARG